jgi:hypothetical protein
LDTWDYEPMDYDIKSKFGSGEYEILIAQEGVIGLQRLKSVSIPWEIEIVGSLFGVPTVDYIRDNYGEGNYYILKSCQPNPIQIYPEGQPRDTTWQNLQDGAGVMRNLSIIAKVKMPWV